MLIQKSGQNQWNKDNDVIHSKNKETQSKNDSVTRVCEHRLLLAQCLYMPNCLQYHPTPAQAKPFECYASQGNNPTTSLRARTMIHMKPKSYLFNLAYPIQKNYTVVLFQTSSLLMATDRYHLQLSTLCISNTKLII